MVSDTGVTEQPSFQTPGSLPLRLAAGKLVSSVIPQANNAFLYLRHNRRVPLPCCEAGSVIRTPPPWPDWWELATGRALAQPGAKKAEYAA